MNIFTSISEMKAYGFGELFQKTSASDFVATFAEIVSSICFSELAGKMVPIVIFGDENQDVYGDKLAIFHLVREQFSVVSETVSFVPDDDLLETVEQKFDLLNRCDERISYYYQGGFKRWLAGRHRRAVLRAVKRRADACISMQDLYSAATSLFVLKKLGTPEQFETMTKADKCD